MHTVEIPDKNIKIYVPEHLGECSAEQYINMCNLAFKFITNQINYTEFKTHGIYYLLNMVPSQKVDEATEIQKFSNLSLLADLVDSFFETNEEGTVKTIKQFYINNPIYKIVGASKNYYGPSNEFNNVKFGEYVDALSHFADFHETGETQYLYLLMATFYREKRSKKLSKEKFTKDIRVVYNSERVDKLAKVFRVQNIGVIYGFYLLFASFQKYLTTAKLYVQGKEIDLSILFDGEETIESDIPGIGMKSTLYTIAESGIFGTLKEVRNTPLWEVLIRMYDIRKRDLDAIAQQKKLEKTT
ncbi:hypothetical protein [Lutibacter sp.]|uniref:hypothetical protein n=1 Tax=Lutibacter sp. TaxID=1925666 RepID=UPI0035618E43